MGNRHNLDIEELFQDNTMSLLRELLEDFEVIATKQYMALIPNYEFKGFRDNIGAAIIASTLGLRSLDYAKRQYCDNKKDAQETEFTKYIDSYKAAKTHIHSVMSQLSTEGKNKPSNGIFGASLVLERLPASFFSAHLLYSLGNEYDAHAVSRLILEQIAWACDAYHYDDINKIRSIVTTKTLSELKRIIPECSRLYGLLSKKTHINYERHQEFLTVCKGRNMVLLSHQNFSQYADVILNLADFFSIVWELSQLDYMIKLESIEVKNGCPAVIQDRPFRKVIESHMNSFRKEC